MRGGLSTIQQTLTAEAASVLNQSIAEAGRRNHGQTTPLHVAATLLASPSGFLRQACIRSHPNSSHPLQCRALELCFSVALERLPTAQNASPGTEPPISNALMAALKRAQAHQRRGCPEQQQQPLLAVKVELEQLIISILDDPSVSRVMREASFSSPAVKATIEQSLNSTSGNVNPGPLTSGFRPTPAPMPMPLPIANRNSYLNPKLQQGASGAQGQQRSDEVKRVVDILMRTKKRNPILVGETEPEAVVKELLRRIEKGELSEAPLKNVQVIQIDEEFVSDKLQIPSKIKELGGLIECRIGEGNGSGAIILSLGDLKWLVEQPVSHRVSNAGGTGVQQQVVSEVGRASVAEMGNLLARFEERGSGGNIWLIGTATCETYLRCQVYHPSMENDWDLQAVPIASRSPLPGMLSRLSSSGNFGSLSDFVSPLKTLPTAVTPLTRRVAEILDPGPKMSFCSQCSQNYEQELAKLVEEFESSSSEVISDAARSPLPQWLQNAKVDNSNSKIATNQSLAKDQDLLYKQKSQELQKKWSEVCLRLHPSYHHNLNSERTAPTPFLMTGLYNPKLLRHQPSQSKLQTTRNIGETLQLNSNQVAKEPLDHATKSPGSPVRTDLVLGGTKVTETTTRSTEEEHVKDFLGCISLQPQNKSILESFKFANALDADSFKRLLNGLMEKAWWQPEAASAVTTTVTQCRLGNRKGRGTGTKGDIWLLFTGPDRVGKKKMALALAEHVCGTCPIIVCFGSQRDDKESNMNIRGKTALDRIAEAVRRNPVSVIMLEDIDEADMLIRGSIKRAMERGRLVDSHGREISLGNVVFILAGNWSTIKNSGNGHLHDERKFAPVARGGWQLRLTIGDKRAKRRANWLHDEDRPTRHRKEMSTGLSFDLNLVAVAEDDRTDGSNNASDLTIDHEDELRLENWQFSITSVPHELVSSVDDTIVFKPVDFNAIRYEIGKTISNKFSSIIDEKISVEVDNDALEKILGGVWHGDTSLTEWTEKVLDPSFQQLKARLPASMLASSNETMVVRLETRMDSDNGSDGDWLPRNITVMVD